MILCANPIYDSVFKALMSVPEVARGIISCLIGKKVLDLKLIPQEHVRKDAESGNLLVLRMDFCAIVETTEGDFQQVIIELQKAKIGHNPLRFRQYLANRYQAVEESFVNGVSRYETLPIVGIYLLGYLLDRALPTVIHVKRHYYDADSGEKVKAGLSHDFIEKLTHDSFFIQIPKITEELETKLHEILFIFYPGNVKSDDPHRIEIDDSVVKSGTLLARIVTELNRLQENPEMDTMMTYEDIHLFEQREAATDAMQELEAERKLRVEAERECLEEKARRKESERKAKELEARLARLEKKMKDRE